MTEEIRHKPYLTGILLMCLATVFMVGLDATARLLLETYALPQLALLRCLFSMLIIFSWAVVRDQTGRLATRRPGWHAFRSLLMAASMFAFFHALRFIPLADVVCIAFAAPLIITSLSQPFLGERVGVWRWTAVIVGFVGVVIVIRPGAGLLHPAALIALGGAVAYAGLALTARKLSTSESTVALSFYSFIISLLIGSVLSVDYWLQPGVFDWLLFALCGGCGGMAFICMNAAYARAPAALIVPFEYTGLIWAATIGYLMWNEIPTMTTWLGAALIVSSGLFILYREAVTSDSSDPGTSFPLQEAVAGVDEEP